MPSTRREFIKYAAMLSGAAGALGAVPESIRRALAIDPVEGSTFLDAEHVVILMQENRSFDHAFGAMRGVRGFNDPRAISIPGGYPVWAQPGPGGERYLPFRLNIRETKATWMGSLPHTWTDQVDARNNGRYDRWLETKRSGHAPYAEMPLTMGHYAREDIPFYYALADAFTVCDQNFCSSLTGTTPNRLHLWTGTIREKPSPDSPARTLNSDTDHGHWAGWTTFPERLEDLGVSWKIYQNELSIESGLKGEEDAWLANFGDNPIEWFTQFNVRFARTRREFVERRAAEIPAQIEELQRKSAAPGTGRERSKPADDLAKRLASLRSELARLVAENAEFTADKFAGLPERARRLHERAFSTNAADPDYRRVVEIAYRDGDKERRVKVPAGDVLHTFRQDVERGELPAVSWIVPPERFSDHPSSAWYGAWYLSEVIDILTHNPDVWRKTIFILTYDENDGYFDHVPPFVAPHPRRPETGKVTAGIDPAMEYVEREQDLARRGRHGARDSAIGLGYRVPMVIASPWSRGGAVCSQVFDHTSVLRLLERVLSHKLGRKVEEPNISAWRRAVCGDLTSAFGPADRKQAALEFLDRDRFVEQIHRARYEPEPKNFRALTPDELAKLRAGADGWAASGLLPRQEPGTRPACPLPYDLAVDGVLNPERSAFRVRFEARRGVFADRAAGSPFTAYAFSGDEFTCRDYAVEPGARLEDEWPLSGFPGGAYRLRVHGPNGFFREFAGGANDPAVELSVGEIGPSGGTPKPADTLDLLVALGAAGPAVRLSVRDNAYGAPEQTVDLAPGERRSVRVPTQRSRGWYDVTIGSAAHPAFVRRYAGRIETGAWTISDPVMGGVA